MSVQTKEIKIYTCDRCGVSFDNKDDLTRHIIIGNYVTDIDLCKSCNGDFEKFVMNQGAVFPTSHEGVSHEF